MERKWVNKEEPLILWQDQKMCIISKGPGWVCAVSRNVDQNRNLWRIRNTSHTHVSDLVNSGKVEHLAHFVILKWKDDKDFELACDVVNEFGIAHRLDVDTSGCLLIAKTPDGFSYLRESFGRHEVYKEYICLCHGLVKNTTDEVELPIAWDEDKNVSYISKEKGQWAKSIYTVMGRYRLRGKRKVFTLCRVVIITGRTHQIRIHMTSIGHPLVSDSKYNHTLSKTDTLWCPRMFLHAWRVGFNDFNKKWQEVKAPLTKDLSQALRVLDEIRIDPESLKDDGAPSIRVAQPSKNQENVPPPPAATRRPGPGRATDDWTSAACQAAIEESLKPQYAGGESDLPPQPPPPPPPPARSGKGGHIMDGKEYLPVPPPPPIPEHAVSAPANMAVIPDLAGYGGSANIGRPVPRARTNAEGMFGGFRAGYISAPVPRARQAGEEMYGGQYSDGRPVVMLPNGRTLIQPDYAPPPPPPPPRFAMEQVMREVDEQAAPVSRAGFAMDEVMREVAEHIAPSPVSMPAPSFAPPPPPARGLVASREALYATLPGEWGANDFAPPPPGRAPPPPELQQMAPAPPPPGLQQATPAAPKPAKVVKKTEQAAQAVPKSAKVEFKKISASEQATLEEEACSLAIRSILDAKNCQLSVGLLGNKQEMLSLLQKCGKRPKLSKLLKDRPDTFTILSGSGELIVTLTQTAMATCRLEQVANLKQASDSSAAEATQKANKERQRRNISEEQTGHSAGALAGNSFRGLSYEEDAMMLVEMGFDYGSAIKALRANYGDVMEAMDMLSNMPAVRSTPARGQVASSDEGEEEMEDGDGEDEMDAFAAALAESQREEEARKHRQALDEQALAAALAQSLAQDAAGGEHAWESFGVSNMPEEAEEDDEEDEEKQLREVLELSQRQEDERCRMHQREEEELMQTIGESQRMYELFFNNTDNEAFEETLRQSLGVAGSGGAASSASSSGVAQQESKEDEQLLEALQLSYNTTGNVFYDDDEDDEFEEAQEVEPASHGPGAASSSGSAAQATLAAPPSSASGSGAGASGEAAEPADSLQPFSFADEDEEEESEIPAQASRGFGKWFSKTTVAPPTPSPAAPRSKTVESKVLPTASSNKMSNKMSQPRPSHEVPNVAAASSSASFDRGAAAPLPSIRDWAFGRMASLGVDFDKDVLWSVIEQVGEEGLGDLEMFKMWLGFGPEDKLPQSIGMLLTELRQQRMLRAIGQHSEPSRVKVEEDGADLWQ